MENGKFIFMAGFHTNSQFTPENKFPIFDYPFSVLQTACGTDPQAVFY